MSRHSVVEAKNQLSALIDKAIRGEHVVITRHGQPVVTLHPVRTAAKTGAVDEIPQQPASSSTRPSQHDGAERKVMSASEFEWLERISVKTAIPAENAAELIRRMRDEGE
jgi:prevent-host-death family protein